MDLEPLGATVRAELDARYVAREKGLPLCRQAVRHCANAIRAVHRGEREQALSLLAQARSGLDRADESMRDHPDIRNAGFFHDAAKEYAEGRLTFALVFAEPLPGPEEVGVEVPAYLNGMGEAIGELRRHILDLMRHGELTRSEELLDAMDEMYYLLIAMDYPDAMTGGLRRTTDSARGIIERTRGDLSTTIIQHNLRRALDEATRGLQG